MAVHVRFESWCISFPYYANQQREMTKFVVFWRSFGEVFEEVATFEGKM